MEAIDIRSGTIIKVEDFPKAKKKAWKLWIDFGELGVKKSSAQITEHYGKKDLLQRQILAAVNLKPKQIADFISECLVLGLADRKGAIVLPTIEPHVPNGQRLH